MAIERADIHVPRTTFTTVFYEKGKVEEGNVGSPVESKDSVAKKVTSDETGHESYYILDSKGRMVNPWTADFWRLDRKRVKWRKVNEVAFEHYLRFLRTGINAHLLNSERTVH